MSNLSDYLEKAAEFERLAKMAETETAKKKYADVAACYRLLAAECRLQLRRNDPSRVRVSPPGPLESTP